MNRLLIILLLLVPAIAGAQEPAKSVGASVPDVEQITQTAAILSAREAARIQFERDIGLAESEFAAAKAVVHVATDRLEALQSMMAAGRVVSKELANEEIASAMAASDACQKKKDRLDFLRTEAARLHIPVSIVEKPLPPKPSYAPVHNRANEAIVMKPVTDLN
jgi:hypothetical protein